MLEEKSGLSSKKERKLNFELLRIISMILIVIYHYSDWGGIINIENPVLNKLFGEFINIGGKLGVNLFVLISGYFLINSRFSSKKILKIVLQVWFYSVGIYVISILLNIVDFSIKDTIKSIFPIAYNMYWFATTYIGMYLLFPFINKLAYSITQNNYKTLIILLGIMTSLIPTIIPSSKPFSSNLIWFIYMYLIAGYMKKYDIKFLDNTKNKYIVILIVLFMFGVSVLCTKLGLSIQLITYFNAMNTIPMLFLSLYIFAFFKNIKVNNKSKIIPFFAKASFGVYLIHINASFREYLFNDLIKIQNYYSANTFILILYVIATALIIYILCSIIDTIRRKILEEPLFKITCFDKYFRKIDSLMNLE